MMPMPPRSAKPNATLGIPAAASQAPPVYRPNTGLPVQRMNAPAVYRPNPGVTAQTIPAAPVNRPHINATIQGMAAPPVYKPNQSAAVQRTNAPAVYRPEPTAPVQLTAAPPAYRPQGAVNSSAAAPPPLRRSPASIPPRQTAAQPVAQAKQLATSAGGMAPQPRSRSTTIQREIYKFEHDKWVLEKLGTPGTKQPPPRPNGGNVYFNTVTGREGSTIKGVEAGLADLIIVKGSLRDAKIDLQWPEYLWNGLQTGTGEGSVTTLGTIRLESGQGPRFKGLQDWLKPLWNELLNPFMERNGQLPYIKGQDWYTSGWMVVDISVNFYNNRSAQDATLGFHKDTAADNLFVNLIFNNKRPILATEWVVDTRKMKAAKKRQMNQYTGSDEVADAINETRSAIVSGGYRPEGTAIIEGGIEAGEAVFVSWVDELIWHSSPYADSRINHLRSLKCLRILRDPKNYRITEAADSVTYLLIRKTLKSLRRIPGTLINRFGKPKGKQTEWVDQINDYIDTIVSPGGDRIYPGWLTHLKDISDNRRFIMPGLSRGEEQAPDPTNNNERIERFTDIAKLPRRNSFIARSGTGEARSLRNAAKTTEPRSFIRTWVQIHREDYPLT